MRLAFRKGEAKALMRGIFRSKFTLILIYLIMAAVCVYLNLTAESIELSNVIVSGALFLIVLILFASHYISAIYLLLLFLFLEYYNINKSCCQYSDTEL